MTATVRNSFALTHVFGLKYNYKTCPTPTVKVNGRGLGTLFRGKRSIPFVCMKSCPVMNLSPAPPFLSSYSLFHTFVFSCL